MPSVRSVAMGLWVRTGCRDEVPEQAGISHFLEHLLFKGTERFSSEEIDQIFDGMGAEVNAGTGKETTSVYARCLDRHSERALEVISDMMLAPAYRDVDSERQVVIEEIAMYEDEPSDKVHDVLAGAVFGDHPLGRPIIGSRRRGRLGADPRHRRLPRLPLRGLQPRAGGGRATSSTTQVVAQAERLLGDRGGRRRRTAPTPVEFPGPPSASTPRTPSSTTWPWAGPGLARGDDRRFALRVLDTLLGGSSSSRLFQEVREKRGLAYAVYSYASSFADIGQVGVYVGTRPDNVGEALAIIGEQLRRSAGRARARRGARPGQGEREGPHRAVHGVDAGPHEPPRQLGADGRADPEPRRAAGRDRRRDRRGRRRAGARALRARRRCRPPEWAPTRTIFRERL